MKYQTENESGTYWTDTIQYKPEAIDTKFYQLNFDG